MIKVLPEAQLMTRNPLAARTELQGSSAEMGEPAAAETQTSQQRFIN